MTEEYIPLEVPVTQEPSELYPDLTMDEAFQKASKEVDRNRAKVRPWEALAASGNKEPRRIWVNTTLLLSHMENWHGSLAHHEATIKELQDGLDEERERAEVTKHKIDQGGDLVEMDGVLIDPAMFDAGFLDMYCHPPEPPKKLKSAREYINFLRPSKP